MKSFELLIACPINKSTPDVLLGLGLMHLRVAYWTELTGLEVAQNTRAANCNKIAVSSDSVQQRFVLMATIFGFTNMDHSSLIK